MQGWLVLIRALILVTLSAWSWSSPQQLPLIEVYGYHSEPPYVVNLDGQTGLSFDAFRLLQSLGEKRFRWRYQQVERDQLNRLLAQGMPAVVLWANPKGFEHQGNRYHWSKPILGDSNVLVVPRTRPISFQVLSDLEGRVIATRKGYYYEGVDELASAGALLRLDASNDKRNLERVIRGEADTAIVSKSSLLFLARQSTAFTEALQLAKFVQRPYYERHLLLTHHYAPYVDVFNEYLQVIYHDPDWRSRLRFYGVQSLMPVE